MGVKCLLLNMEGSVVQNKVNIEIGKERRVRIIK